MAKKSRRARNRAPAPRNEAPAEEPTVSQLERLGTAEGTAAALAEEHGPPRTEGIAEEPAPTLEESLKRVEGLLNDARGLFERARDAEATAKRDLEQVEAQKRDQEQAHRKRRKDLDEEVVGARRELERQVRAVDQRDQDLVERERACTSREAELAETRKELVARAYDAEQGFLADKARVLEPIEEELQRLRERRDALEAELTERRARAEEELRVAVEERAARQAEVDAVRTRAVAEAQRQLDEELAAERRVGLAALRDQLLGERAQAEGEWQAVLDRRKAELDAREADLDELDQALLAKRREHRASALDLQTEQAILEEDRAALDRTVERLVAERTEDLRHQLRSLEKLLADARARRDRYFEELEGRREAERRFGDRSPQEVLAELDKLERERAELSRQVQELPDAGAARRLAHLERDHSALLEERAALQGELARARGELATRRLAAIELEALRKQKEALEVHKQLLDGAVDELRVRVAELTRQEDHRNPMTVLTSLDEREDLQTKARTTGLLGRATPTLRAFAEDLRHRIATGVDGRTLYYAERDVRAFLGGLAMTRLLLLQGISGTGKTSLPLAFANAVGGEVEVVPVQAGWRDRQDLIGYFNAFHGKYYATPFLEALYRAGTPAHRDRIALVVLDEINLSRPEQFFADFLSQLEQPAGRRRITLLDEPRGTPPRLMPDGKVLPIPPNVWFVGTANHDETTVEFADKTYDRAHVMEMPRKTEAAHFEVAPRGHRSAISYARLEEAFGRAADAQQARVGMATEWLRNAPFTHDLDTRFRVGWGNRLEQQLARYLPVVVEAGGTVGEAMDHLLETKVLRKLKDRHDVRATALEELQDKLLSAWEQLDNDTLPERCLALLKREVDAKKGEELV